MAITENLSTRKVFDGMKESAKDFYDLLIRKELYSNFADWPLEKQVQTVIDEATELKKEIENNNVDEIRKETIDVLYVTLMSISSMYTQGLIDDEFLASMGSVQREKIMQRSPFLKEHYKPTSERENEIWYETKAKLKEEQENK